MLACPDDGGRLGRAGNELRCINCERHYRAANGVWELLPRETLDAASPQGKKLESYRAGYSQRSGPRMAARFPCAERRTGGTPIFIAGRAAPSKKSRRGVYLRILDAGCGDAMLWRHINRRHQYVGADFSTRPLSRAYRYHPAAYIRGDLNRLPFVSGAFDLVLSMQALQYLEQPELAVHEMARVLRPDGQLVATLPNDGCFKYRWQGAPAIQRHRFRRREVMELFGPEFTVRELGTQGLWIPAPSISVHLPGRYFESCGIILDGGLRAHGLNRPCRAREPSKAHIPRPIRRR